MPDRKKKGRVGRQRGNTNEETRVIRTLTTSVIGILLLSLTSCGRTYRMYDGPARSKTEVALLTRAPESDARLLSVDGKRWPRRIRRFELLPGSYGVLVGFERNIVTCAYPVMYSQRVYAHEDVQVGFEAEAGHRYAVYAEVGAADDTKLQRSHALPNSWYEALPVGENVGNWRAVVCDLDTGQVVASRGSPG